MNILALDTSGKQAGAAIMDEYITIGEIVINAQSGPKTWHHSEILMPAIERMFALSGYELADMDYVAYTAGPGSFTGLRIGAATALGLARGIDKPAIAVPTLDALAYNVMSAETHGTIVPMMDARRGQVYTAIYTWGPQRLTEYMALPVEEVIEMLDGYASPVIFLGDGADEYRDVILSKAPWAIFAPQNANRQRPSSVGLCAMHMLKGGPPPETVELIYVRDPQAVRAAKKS